MSNTMLTPNARLLQGSPSSGASGLLLLSADTPNTWKVSTLLEELELPYDVQLIDISADEQKQPWYMALNPNGRTPTLIDRGDGQQAPFSVFESGAILLYLADKYRERLAEKGLGALLPSHNEAMLRSEVEQWLMWQMSALGPMLGNAMYFKRIAAPVIEDLDALQFGLGRYERESLRLLGVLEERLVGGSPREYLCGPGRGEYSLADIACFHYCDAGWWAGLDSQIATMPNLQQWLKRLRDRAAIQRGLCVPNGGESFRTAVTSEAAAKRDAVEANAKRAGRPHFGWRDIAEIEGRKNPRKLSSENTSPKWSP